MKDQKMMNPIEMIAAIGRRHRRWMLLLSLPGIFAAGCKTGPLAGQMEPRRGDEIVAAGQFFHTGTPVVLWMDP
ncbi:MAG TPA: hypothetical protein VN761_09365, partial [Candidatus Polarisedimenticolia bacterium]|nr:hypothetical protein [Candidatus Polarisedimenticolia bacterium]